MPTKKEIQIGTPVKYKQGNKRLKGIVHGVAKADNPNGTSRVLYYLVDTGNDERLDVYAHNPRDEEISKRLAAAIRDNPDIAADSDSLQNTLNKISQQDDLPKSKVIENKVRQPEQVQVLPKNIILS